MNKIKILTENVANKIAAGEVVERPASVVKELVENSIDSGATKITVEVKGGGVSMIKVSDNGCGMSRDDALLSLERHATSKIKDVDDIYSIKSMGFRGEALPSIAAVSRFEMTTSEGDSEAGTAIRVEGGKILDIKEAAAGKGTVVNVQELFFNVPARRKFLKSAQTETSHIINIVTLNALPYNDIAFKLIDNGKDIISVEKGMDLRLRISHLFGSDYADALLPVEWKGPDIEITGYVSKPEYTFSNRSKEYFFVNNRAVQNRTLLYAVSEGYRTLMPQDRNPFCFLFITIDPSKADVNIHPAKRDIRFVNEAAARDAVIGAIKGSLGKFYDMPAVAGENKIASVAGGNLPGGVSDAIKRFYESDKPAQVFPPEWRQNADISHARGGQEAAASESHLLTVPVSKERPVVIGQTNNLYIIAETRDGMIIIDQHAAHERVLYERTMKWIKDKKPESQKLLMPVTIELPKAQYAMLSQYVPAMEKMGVGINVFGENAYLVDEVPAFVKNGDIKQLFKDIVEDLEAGARTNSAAAAAEEKIVKTMCRLAVKAEDRLSPREQEALVQDLCKCEVPNTCPHGRPTMIKLSNDHLAREFKRK